VEANGMDSLTGRRIPVHRVVAVAGTLLWLLAVLGAARADFVAYTFTARDGYTGSPVTGSFSYDTSAPYTSRPPGNQPGAVSYGDVRGSLTITDNGHTYSTTAVSGSLDPVSLVLYGSSAPGAPGLYVVLEWHAPWLTDLLSLPRFDPSSSQFSAFAITAGPTQPNIGGGPIAAFAAETASPITPLALPEPGGLTLAAIAAVGGLAAARRRRHGVARPRPG
jgi:hypothetical protein